MTLMNDLANRRTQAARSNGVRDSFGHDLDDRLTGISTWLFSVPGDPSPADLRDYTYDQLGNRLTKTSGIDTFTTYYYDVHEPTPTSWNNRLVRYTTSQSAETTLEVTYEYDDIFSRGDVTRVLYHDLTPCEFRTGREFRAIRFYYDTSGRVWLVYEEEWDEHTWNAELPEPACESGCEHYTARCTEFRYDSGRARYLMRTRDPSTLSPTTQAVWTDYDGNSPYEDYAFNTSTSAVTSNTTYVPGLGQRDAATGNLAYHHGDQIDSMRQMTNGGGAVVRRQTYTAFGERIQTSGSQDTRYKYAGAFGYECITPPGASTPPPFIHVGERWYDPNIGRFLQRDPIGISGGINPYAYVSNRPSILVDPDGESSLLRPDVLVAVLEASGGVQGLVGRTIYFNGQRAIITKASIGAVGSQVVPGAGNISPSTLVTMTCRLADGTKEYFSTHTVATIANMMNEPVVRPSGHPGIVVLGGIVLIGLLLLMSRVRAPASREALP